MGEEEWTGIGGMIVMVSKLLRETSRVAEYESECVERRRE